MKYIKQFLIILLISFIGELMNYYIPLPVPASIYGMIILFLCLSTGIIKLSDVKDAGKFLIEIMPLMFIPAGVGLIDSWGVLKPLLLPVTGYNGGVACVGVRRKRARGAACYQARRKEKGGCRR